ncbi:contractile injection system protein, VgrG/Pvc8 family [Dechloromonas denitrificans]|uniref:contractile injection system protein, VgrG/Pvc8 family n=1 Tax=Dechloromonas denitrificans TaxID=281362 RepID=UPI003083F1C9
MNNQHQAIDARLKQFHGEGSVRTAAPGTTFLLADHPEHDRDMAEQRRFLITAITHHACNNLGETRIGTSPAVDPQKSSKTKDEPV